ncbi:hAT family dimerization protein [Rhizoctonia solani 123E]|uniref:HAT family dimerization protein n=1 Tax=Rhizoctonia solani 123E TaxID=1423351 RepID=A0A074S8D3_9AGAM|nr:hAT family dimerization protein [Rhizoctonia solani 123E]
MTLRALKACKEKLVEYFDKSTYDSEYYYFAMVLDPRYKDSLFKANSDMIEDLLSAEWMSDCANALIQTCQEFYSLPFDGPLNESQPQKSEIVGFNTFSHAFRASVPQRSGQSFNTRSASQELADYFSEDVIPDTQSPLAWWQVNAAQFPRLAPMARDFLCIPGSSVAVERVLSTGRDVISLRRASLSAETIRVLMNYRAGIMLEKRTGKTF